MVYELMYIIPGRYAETELEPILKQVQDLIQKHNGIIKQTMNWGKKKLAYPIQHTHQGYYILNDLELAPTTVNQINEAIKLMPEILRHQIVKKSEVIARPIRPIVAASTEKIDQTSLTAQPPISQPAINLPTTEGPLTELPAEAPAMSKPKKKISLEELDEKIDEILKKDII